MPDLLATKSLPQLNVPEQLLPWAHQLVNALFGQLMDIATILNSLSSVSPTSHNLLSATHLDTVTSVPVRGDMIVANSSPAWDNVALPASAPTQVWGNNGTDPIWLALTKAHLPMAIAYEDENNTFALSQVFQSYLEMISSSAPASPNPGGIRMYGNKTGTVVEVRLKFEDGFECVVCTRNIGGAVPQTLPLQWVQ